MVFMSVSVTVSLPKLWFGSRATVALGSRDAVVGAALSWRGTDLDSVFQIVNIYSCLEGQALG